MIFEEMLRDERAEGKAEGKVEDTLELLKELGEIPESVRNRIMNERNLETQMRITILNQMYFIFLNDFYFFHYGWFLVFCQFSIIQQSDPVSLSLSHTHIHIHIYILLLTLSSIRLHHK